MIIRARVYFIGIILGALLLVLTGRLFFIQVVKGQQYAKESRRQTRQRALLPAVRGRILDVKGRVLAKNVERKLQTSQDIAAFVVSSMDSSTDKVRQRSIQRVYPYGELAGTVLGYIGRDGDGLSGVEFAFDEVLQGEDGWTILQRDGRNFRYRKIGLPTKKPVTGADVYLTIDAEVQEIAENVLARTVRQLDARGGMCIITEPHTGRVVAMAGYPGFNPNVAGHFPLAQRKNKCIEYNYEPGSTFKIITAASALQDGAIGERDILDGGNGVYEIYDQVIRDRRAFGKLTLSQALTVSSNVCFAKVAGKLGDHALYRYAKEFGFGSRTGIELPGEEAGTFSPVKRWSGRTGPTVAIGQEISVTLLQMMAAIGCVANDGVLIVPRVCDKVVDASGRVTKTGETRPVRQVLKSEIAGRMREMLSHVVSEGTGTRASIDGIPMGGKTGTSQKYDRETGTYSTDRYWSSFVGFVPVEKPVLLCGVVIDEPGNGESGGVAAAPAFRKIMSQIISNPGLSYGEEILLRSREQENESEIKEKHGDSSPALVTAGVSPGRSTKDSKKSLVHRTALRMPEARGSEKQIAVPDVRNQDARDAVRILCMTGLLPYVSGSGRVQRQNPEPGKQVQGAEVCTLFCSVNL